MKQQIRNIHTLPIVKVSIFLNLFDLQMMLENKREKRKCFALSLGLAGGVCKGNH